MGLLYYMKKVEYQIFLLRNFMFAIAVLWLITHILILIVCVQLINKHKINISFLNK